MPSFEDAVFAASIDSHIYTIDLHDTSSVYEALEQLERELFLCYTSGHPYCEVVHGIGQGVLMNAVQQAVEKNPMVTGWQKQGGSTLVIFTG